MNVLSLFSFVAALVYAGLGLYALQPRPRTVANRTFVFLCAAMFFWALTFTFAYPAATAEEYVLWTRLSALGSAASPSIFLHFALVLTAPRRRVPAWALVALYVPVAVTIAGETLGELREGIDFVRGWAGWTRTFAGIRPVFALQRLVHVGLFVAGIVLIHRWGRRSAVPRERLQARVIVRTGAVAVGIALVLDTLLPLAGLRPLPTTVPIVGTVWASGIAYAMLRHRFMVLDPELAGGILHDFNNLLTAVQGHIALARIAHETGPEAARSLDEADRAAQRAQRLARRFMAYVTGQRPPRDRFRARDLVRDAALLVADRPGCRCELDLASDLGWLEADESQVLQALGNLLVNAREAMPEGGRIRLRADRCIVDRGRTGGDGPPPGRYVRIRVADEGRGVPPDLLPRLFEPFFTTKSGGTGLGLATVQRVVREHGGAVAVRSEPGRGTEFTLWLPSAADARPPAGAARPVAAGRRILVMDDDRAVAAVTADLLKALGHRTTVCHDGSEAVRRYAEAASSGESFDAVVVDCQVPNGMGGPETLAGLLAVDPYARVILATGSPEDLEDARGAALGFAGYLTKPYTLQGLAEVLEGVALRSGRPPQSPPAGSPVVS